MRIIIKPMETCQEEDLAAQKVLERIVYLSVASLSRLAYDLLQTCAAVAVASCLYV